MQRQAWTPTRVRPRVLPLLLDPALELELVQALVLALEWRSRQCAAAQTALHEALAALVVANHRRAR